jgi:CBS domain-containing protein
MRVKTIMTDAVGTCGSGTNLASVVETMWTHRCGIVPVVNDRREAIGVVTDRDICIALGTRDVAASSLTARDVMTQPVIGCEADDDVFSALLTMEQHDVRRLPVTGSHGVLVGIVSLDDIVRRAAGAPASDPLRMAVLEVLAEVAVHRPRAQTAVGAG